MIPGLIARIRSLWRGIRRRPDLETAMNDEFRHHQEMRAADLERSGLSAAEAARQAKLEFGSAERYKDEARESRGLRRVDELRVSWLDFKLGFRMLARYPGLTLVGGLAMAFAIWMGAATFELVSQVLTPTLPLAEPDRLVGLRLWDAQRNRPESRMLHDFTTWRTELKSVEDLGAFRSVQRNLILGEGQGEPIEVAEINAAGFRVTRVPPLLGRSLMESDEEPGAPPVVVIGHDLWQERFAGDSTVIGRVIRVGRSQTTIVGVMPEKYAFPVSQNFWVPLKLDALDYGRRQGPGIRAFARLAPGASMSEARSELAALGARAAADFPNTHEHLRPQVMPYAKMIFDISGIESLGLFSVNIPVIMLLVLVCANVALLMFARAATREAEIAVRNALGASRGRIIMQLFAEALVLGTIAALIGLAAAGSGLRWVMHVIEVELLEGDKLPFWFDGNLSPITLFYAALLTLIAAVIAGVVPALKVTRGMGTSLQQSSAGGGGLKFGGVWTAVIITQVAVTVAFPVVTFFIRHDATRLESVDVGFPDEQYLSLRLEMDREPPPGAAADTSPAAFRERYRTTWLDLERRLVSDPSVAGVTFGDLLPRMYHPYRLIGVDEGGAAPLNPQWPDGYRVSSAQVALDFFEVVRTPILRGRAFHAGDVQLDAAAPGDEGARGGPVIVNELFVRLVLGERNPIGRRIRYVHLEEWDGPRPEAASGPWYEIVGVVGDMGARPGADPKVARIYHPTAEGKTYPAHIAVHVKGDPESFIPRLRALATATDPTLRLYDIEPMDQTIRSELEFLAFWFRLLLAVCGVALVLSLAGIYAVMSFTVAKRTREIGIRVALGASHVRVIRAIFVRPLTQVSLGILAGVVLMGSLMRVAASKFTLMQGAALLGYALFMLGVCMLACIVPTRRALRVEPTEALRGDG